MYNLLAYYDTKARREARGNRGHSLRSGLLLAPGFSRTGIRKAVPVQLISHCTIRFVGFPVQCPASSLALRFRFLSSRAYFAIPPPLPDKIPVRSYTYWSSRLNHIGRPLKRHSSAIPAPGNRLRDVPARSRLYFFPVNPHLPACALSKFLHSRRAI